MLYFFIFRNYHALLRDVFLTIFSKKTILNLRLLYSFSYRSKYLRQVLHNYKEVIMSYNSKLIEIHPINKLMKLSKSLCTFTASVYLFYYQASARSIIITMCNLQLYQCCSFGDGTSISYFAHRAEQSLNKAFACLS